MAHDTLERMTYATGVYAINADTLTGVAYKCSAVSDAVTYGYIPLGYSGSGNTDLSDRITFATSGIAAHTDATISESKSGTVSISDNATYGYVTNGWTSSTADRITFSTGVAASHTDALPVAAAGEMGGGNSDGATYGYMYGSSTAGGYLDDGARLTFSTGVMAAHADADTAAPKAYMGCFSDGAV
jgi:hypothetical protein